MGRRLANRELELAGSDQQANTLNYDRKADRPVGAQAKGNLKLALYGSGQPESTETPPGIGKMRTTSRLKTRNRSRLS